MFLPPPFGKTVAHVGPSFHLSEAGDRSVAAWIETAFHHSRLMPDERAGMAHRLFETSQDFNVRAPRLQFIDQGLPDPCLELEGFGGRSPSPAEHPARRTHC